jgi:20S proteasome subunit alpha 2
VIALVIDFLVSPLFDNRTKNADRVDCPNVTTATNGVVLATEKKMPTILIDENSLIKTTKIAEHVGMVYSGMGPDARVLLRKARKIAQQYYHVYHEPIPVQQIVREIASVMQEFTQSGYVPRGVGVSHGMRLVSGH